MAEQDYRPTQKLRRMVEVMAGCGVLEVDIARALGIDRSTLRAHHNEELETGAIIANAKVAESLFRKATGDGPQSVTAAVFWLKARAGWRDAGSALDDRVQARLDAMSNAELEAMIVEFQRKRDEMAATVQ